MLEQDKVRQVPGERPSASIPARPYMNIDDIALGVLTLQLAAIKIGASDLLTEGDRRAVASACAGAKVWHAFLTSESPHVEGGESESVVSDESEIT